MAYIDIAATATNEAMISRIMACGVQQALTFVNDLRPEFKLYAQAVIASEANARQLVWPVCGKPNITTDTLDADILAAVQAVWPLVGASYVPA